MNEEQKLKAEDAKWRRAELKRGGRPEPSWEEKAKAEEAVRRRHAELVRRLTICIGPRRLQFDPVMVENLDCTIELRIPTEGGQHSDDCGQRVRAA